MLTCGKPNFSCQTEMIHSLSAALLVFFTLLTILYYLLGPPEGGGQIQQSTLALCITLSTNLPVSKICCDFQSNHITFSSQGYQEITASLSGIQSFESSTDRATFNRGNTDLVFFCAGWCWFGELATNLLCWVPSLPPPLTNLRQITNLFWAPIPTKRGFNTRQSRFQDLSVEGN